jgi:deoxycytidylate deaminase
MLTEAEAVQIAALNSTCLKRAVVCVLYDEAGRLVVARSNRCNPPDSVCARMGVRQGQEGYPVDSECNWTHAEIRAVAAIPPGVKVVRAVLYGHGFPCAACEAALRAAGVTEIQVVPEGHGTGLRAVAEGGVA